MARPKAPAVAFRRGSTRVEVENEGRGVFLYDDQNRGALTRARAVDLFDRPTAANARRRDERLGL